MTATPGGIRAWLASERPRERLLAQGAAALSDAELVAIFLRTGVRGKSAVDLARGLLNHFGGLRGLLEAEAPALYACTGLGPAKYAQLQASVEMARRHLAERLSRGESLNNPQLTSEFLQARLRGLPHEVFACLHLDSQHRVLGFEELFRGTLDGASVYPREVVKSALRHNAAALIFAHNRAKLYNQLITNNIGARECARYPYSYPHLLKSLTRRSHAHPHSPSRRIHHHWRPHHRHDRSGE